jgi:hypothetical protein
MLGLKIYAALATATSFFKCNCDLQGLVASGSCLFLQFWSNQKSGPIFVAAYTPMQPIFSTFFGVLFLGDALFLGR